MSADFARVPYPVLERISSRVMNEVPGINQSRLRHLVQTPRHVQVGIAGGRLWSAASGGGRAMPSTRRLADEV